MAHENDPRFVQYYTNESATQRAFERARGIMATVMRARSQTNRKLDRLEVADIGCNAGTQSRCWLDQGHSVRGLDISRDLVALARERNSSFGSRATFEVGSATHLPWPSDSLDVCLLPELLEHVEDWQSCLVEAVRVLKPGGTLYLSTTNVLCPVQQEFELPGYSWYPGRIKKRFMELARTTRPEIANFATYPAVNWFSPYGLAGFLRALDCTALDRFDLMDDSAKTPIVRAILWLVRSLGPLRFAAHVAIPGTVMLAFKLGQTSQLKSA